MQGLKDRDLAILLLRHKDGALRFPHCEVEELRLLLVGPPLGQTRFVQVAVRHAGLDRLGGRAVGEALGDVAVVQHRHVLQGGQSGAPGLLHLEAERRREEGPSDWKCELFIFIYLFLNPSSFKTLLTQNQVKYW